MKTKIVTYLKWQRWLPGQDCAGCQGPGHNLIFASRFLHEYHIMGYDRGTGSLSSKIANTFPKDGVTNLLITGFGENVYDTFLSEKNNVQNFLNLPAFNFHHTFICLPIWAMYGLWGCAQLPIWQGCGSRAEWAFEQLNLVNWIIQPWHGLDRTVGIPPKVSRTDLLLPLTEYEHTFKLPSFHFQV